MHYFTRFRFVGSLEVTVYGSWIPATIFGRFRAICSIIRVFWISLCLGILERQRYDIIFNDQIAAANPLLRRMSNKLVFYLHFPDQLLCQNRGTRVRRLYRKVVDCLEARCTADCDIILANSQFTVDNFHHVFTSLSHLKPKVVYPPVNLPVLLEKFRSGSKREYPEITDLDMGAPFFLSLNRYERKKQVEIAIRATEYVVQRLPRSALTPSLVIAGKFAVPVTCSVYIRVREVSAFAPAASRNRECFKRACPCR
eukprot:GHVT01008443.1.p1 GENE.GHVT01008443.1~~GHVT01008443.1.p1  ORF type:complete len:255 (+),score=2.26 GHVT01008443.1:222-986(+)